MAAGRLIWVGLLCCIMALMAQLFPNAAFQAGADPAAAWLLFGFGIFLVLISAYVTVSVSRSRGCSDRYDK